MKKDYKKLVRDLIPDIIRRNGSTCETRTMGLQEYRQALVEKLCEEAGEVRQATGMHETTQLITELADVYEVLEAVLNAYDIIPSTLQSEQHKRRLERGGFEQRIELLWTE
jgi:predicted house-cleaning noncanonical NTP pyrophosphatase (MazG superfamily)